MTAKVHLAFRRIVGKETMGLRRRREKNRLHNSTFVFTSNGLHFGIRQTIGTDKETRGGIALRVAYSKGITLDVLETFHRVEY